MEYDYFEKEKEILKHILKVLEQNKIPFYIKHHPQQNVEPFKTYLDAKCFIEKSYPVELYYSKNVILAGEGSSSLLNASLLGYYVLDLAPLFGERKNCMSLKYEWLHIPTIESFGELEYQIKNVNSNNTI